MFVNSAIAIPLFITCGFIIPYLRITRTSATCCVWTMRIVCHEFHPQTSPGILEDHVRQGILPCTDRAWHAPLTPTKAVQEAAPCIRVSCCMWMSLSPTLLGILEGRTDILPGRGDLYCTSHVQSHPSPGVWGGYTHTPGNPAGFGCSDSGSIHHASREAIAINICLAVFWLRSSHRGSDHSSEIGEAFIYFMIARIVIDHRRTSILFILSIYISVLCIFP